MSEKVPATYVRLDGRWDLYVRCAPKDFLEAVRAHRGYQWLEYCGVFYSTRSIQCIAPWELSPDNKSPGLSDLCWIN